MVDVVTYDPEAHGDAWRKFIVEAYKNPNYVLLSPAFLRWQFLDNPANKTGAHTLWVVEHDGAVIAQLGIVPFVGSAPDGERFDGAYPINLIVRPDYQAVGLGAVLMNRLLKETSCVLNPGSSEAGATLCAGLGMQDLGCLRRYVLATDLERAQALATDGRLPSAARVTVAMDEDRYRRRFSTDARASRCGAGELRVPPALLRRAPRSHLHDMAVRDPPRHRL